MRAEPPSDTMFSMKRSLLVAILVASGCGPAPTLEFWVGAFEPRGAMGVARVSVLATDGYDVGAGAVTLVQDEASQVAPLVHGRARFEVSCPGDGARCASPVRLEARWNALVAHYEGRLSKTASGPAVPQSGGVSETPVRLTGTPSVVSDEPVIFAGHSTISRAFTVGSPGPPRWDESFHPGVQVRFLFRGQPPNVLPPPGTEAEVCLGSMSGTQCCQMDADGRCTLPPLPRGTYSGTATVWSGDRTSLATARSEVRLSVRVFPTVTTAERELPGGW